MQPLGPPLQPLGVKHGVDLARKNARRSRELAAFMADSLSQEARRAGSGPVSFAATGPDVYLAVNEAGDPHWPQRLAAELEGLASVADQSDGYAVFRIEGPGAVDVMAKRVLSAIPVDWSFAMAALPAGRPLPTTAAVRSGSLRETFTPAEAAGFEADLRAVLETASTKQAPVMAPSGR